MTQIIDKQKGNRGFSEELIPGQPLWLQSFNPLPSLKEAESVLIREAMKQAKGNQTIAAQLLGITRQTLINKLKKQSEENGSSLNEEEN